MKRNNKILICCISCVVFLFVLSFAIIAASNSNAIRGENYDTTHENNGCCTAGSDEPHYNYGYEDGWTDGYNTQQSTIDSLLGELNKPSDPGDGSQNPGGDGDNLTDSEWEKRYYALLSLYNSKSLEYEEMNALAAEYVSCFLEANSRLDDNQKVNEPVLDGKGDYTSGDILSQNEKNQVINNYLTSSEYKEIETQVKVIAISEFKGSQEYEDILTEQLSAGEQLGYQTAIDELYDVVYNIGVSDGYSAYMGTTQFEGVLNANRQSAYELGVKDGYEQSKQSSTNTTTTTFDLTTLLSLIIAIVGLLIFSVFVTAWSKKKRNKKR